MCLLQARELAAYVADGQFDWQRPQVSMPACGPAAKILLRPLRPPPPSPLLPLLLLVPLVTLLLSHQRADTCCGHHCLGFDAP